MQFYNFIRFKRQLSEPLSKCNMTSFMQSVGERCTDLDLTNPDWLGPKLGREVDTSILQEMVWAGGMSADMNRISVTFKDGGSETYVIKRTKPSSVGSSRQLGLFREAFFFHALSSIFPVGFLPKTYHIYGNIETGEKLLLMEDLQNAVQSGYFFGPGSPLNWGKDLAALTTAAPGVTMVDILKEVALMAAAIHAKFWRNRALLEHSWLRGAEWIEGKGQAAWQASQDYTRDNWIKIKEKMKTEDYKVNWDPNLVAIMDASINKISWGDFMWRLQREPWTLVHGDFHPANMMWRTDRTSNHIVLLDWEVIGIGSGAQDLGQYFISHSTPESRRAYEIPILHQYYAELLLHGVSASEYSWEQCFKDYVAGGAERWVWLLALLGIMCPDAMTQYFHDQVAAFMFDHGVTPDSVGMPRA